MKNKNNGQLIEYIDIDKDTAEFSNDFSTTEEKIKSGLTIGAKVVGNIGIGTVNIGVSFLKALPKLIDDHAQRIEEKNKKN